MDAHIDPFDGRGLLKNQTMTEETEETEYKCGECREDWEGESCIGFVSDICANCGAVGAQSKVEK